MKDQNNREKAKPFSIRLTDTEKAVLQEKAAGMPLGIFIRSLILGENAKSRIARRQAPVKDGEQIGRLLGFLGSSRLSSNLNQLAKAVHTGSLPVTPETEHDLKTACADVAEMRGLLLRALGKQPPKPDVHKLLTRIFEDAASPEGRPE